MWSQETVVWKLSRRLQNSKNNPGQNLHTGAKETEYSFYVSPCQIYPYKQWGTSMLGSFLLFLSKTTFTLLNNCKRRAGNHHTDEILSHSCEHSYDPWPLTKRRLMKGLSIQPGHVYASYSSKLGRQIHRCVCFPQSSSHGTVHILCVRLE